MRAAPERWTAILNPAAGRGRARARLPRTVEALATAGLDIEILVSADGHDLVAQARAAFARDRGVVACGGDGTVAALAGVASVDGGVLGVLPIGSGNDFARQLAVPRDHLGAAIDVLRTGHVEQVDLGRAHTADGAAAWFTTVANTGFDAAANAWANQVTAVSGTPLYVLAVLRTLGTYTPTRVRVAIDDVTVETEAWLVAVGNTRTYASGMMIAPTASIHDGLVDVCIVGPVGRAEFLRTFPSVFRGTHVDHPQVHSWQGSTVQIESLGASSDIDLWASGEHVGSLPARVEAVPGALAVMAPGPTTRAPAT